MAVIYFGIPSEEKIINNIDRWAGISGAPDIFSEKISNLEKFQTKFLGKYDVVSIDEALERYPDAVVWVTFAKADITAKMLLTKMPPEKIRFFEAELEYRKGCEYLGRFINYRKESFSPCNMIGEGPVIRTAGGVRQRIEEWRDYTEKLIEDIRRERISDCENCPMLEYGFWNKNVGLKEICFGSLQQGDICNFSCLYCFCEFSYKQLKKIGGGYTTYEILKELSEMPEYDNEEFIVRLSNGEICANKDFDRIIGILAGTKWKIDLSSNFSVYNEKLAEIMESGRMIRAEMSLDAGTKETFRRIKRSDSFEDVVENIRKYPTHETDFYIKYIFLDGVNDNETDVDGYYEIVREAEGIVTFSSNINAPYTEKMLELCYRIIDKAVEDDIEVDTSSIYLNREDKEFIDERYF